MQKSNSRCRTFNVHFSRTVPPYPYSRTADAWTCKLHLLVYLDRSLTYFWVFELYVQV